MKIRTRLAGATPLSLSGRFATTLPITLLLKSHNFGGDTAKTRFLFRFASCASASIP